MGQLKGSVQAIERAIASAGVELLNSCGIGMGASKPANKSFQPTRPFVTVLAGARPAPIVLAAEADVRSTRFWERHVSVTNGISCLLLSGGMREFCDGCRSTPHA